MEFKNIAQNLQFNFEKLAENATYLFQAEVDKDEMWEAYLEAFPEGTNPMFRVRREYDCSCCRQFIKAIGNAVFIQNGEIKTIWDFSTGDDVLQVVVEAMDDYVKSKVIAGVFYYYQSRVGTSQNHENAENGIVEYNHFSLMLPNKFVMSKDQIPSQQGDLLATKNVFQRSLEELTEDSVLTVLELIAQNSLYKGEEWERTLKTFLGHKRAYDKVVEGFQDIYCWENAVKVGPVIGRIRNHSIGTLLIDISNGIELDTAVKKYEAVVAPNNYKRPKPIFTQKMLDDAKVKIEELGYLDSLQRRYANLDDITVNNILFANRDVAKRLQGTDVFGNLAVTPKSKKFSKVEEIHIDDFVTNVLPQVEEVEVMVENKHKGNFVSLIAPIDENSKNMFKWDNGFGWAYSGNMTDSMIKENVKNAGGSVTGDLRFSIQWNDNGDNPNDYDAHCTTPDTRIYFGHVRDRFGGWLDVDIQAPRGVAVENIAWQTRSMMVNGNYVFSVHNYRHRGGTSGFKAEIEFDGNIYLFEYPHDVKNREAVEVAVVNLKNGVFTIVPKLSAETASQEIWNIKTNEFVPVSVMMYSPNYWNEQQGIGNKHYFFMLKGCESDEQSASFFNEYLNQELNEHRKVLEALGTKLAVQSTPNQLSGLGFASTKRNELVVKVKGATERILKIKF